MLITIAVLVGMRRMLDVLRACLQMLVYAVRS